MQSILGSGRFGSPPRQQQPQQQARQHQQTHSYTSSSEDSYGRVNSYSRSESGTSQTHYDDFNNAPSSKANHHGNDSLDWNLARSSIRSPRGDNEPQDPVAMHLLVETAVGDSSQFDVLSIEDLEQVKKEEAMLARRLPALQRDLQLETKVRDAARSYSRLSDRSGRSVSGKHGSKRGSSEEYSASAQKCEHLANQIFEIERRQRDLSDRRLKHTAGVLQMNYEHRSGQTEYRQVNGAEDANGWSDGFNLRQYAPGGLADTFDGIMDIPGGRDPHMDETLSDLWHVVSSHDHIANGQPRDYQATNGDGGQQDFSLDEFSAKIQRICSRAANLSENQMALETQLKQEREQWNIKSAEHANLREQLQDAHDQHLASQRKVQDSQSDIMELRAYLEQAKQEISFRKQQHQQNLSEERDAEREARKASEHDLLQQLEARNIHIAGLEQSHREAQQASEILQSQNASHEATVRDLQSTDTSTTSRLAELTASLASAQALATHHESRAAESTKQAFTMETERTDLEAEVVRLQTEVTVARAELDGAYGTRAQRAAEVAGNPEMRKDFEGLQSRNNELQNELRELVGEHEALVRQGVESERERETLESMIDGLRDRVEAQEVRLSEERMRSLGRRGSGTSNAASTPGAGPSTPGAPDREGNATSMSVMRNEFKKMMRDARAEQFKALRVCATAPYS